MVDRLILDFAPNEAWHAALREYGWKVCVCEGADDAIGVLCAYLGVG